MLLIGMIRRACTLVILALHTGGIHAELLAPTLPIRTVAILTEFNPVDYPITPYDGRLYFSQPDKSGKGFDIVALDMADQSTEYILRRRAGGHFIAQSDRYLVIGEKERLTSPLAVIERRSGERLKANKSLKLQQDISWARIRGNRLIAIQGTWLGNGYASKAPAVVLELPSLKVLRSVEIIGGNDVQAWDGKILSLGTDLAAYDDNFNEQFRITLPRRKTGEGGSCTATGPLRIYGNKAVIVANCGELLIYDLPTRQLERTIPSHALAYAVAIVDGLIFTTPSSEGKQRDRTHVHDLYTGRQLAVLPINATDLFGKGDRLLAVEREFAKPSTMTLYAIDAEKLRNGLWRVERVLKECQQAETLLQASGDLYGAIESCRATGIDGMVDEAKQNRAVLSALSKYALWLSRTFDRSRDAKQLLEALRKITSSREINRALAEVRLKSRVLEGNELGLVSTDELQTEFARALDTGSRLPRAATKNVEFGAFPNLFHFSGDRVYIGRFGCRGCSEEGASIGVLDRNSFEQVASIPIAPDDLDFQDSIASIAADRNRIYASISYRQAQIGRPNFVAIDKASLNILKKAQVEAPASLLFDRGPLLACNCSSTAEQNCKTINPETAEVADLADLVCVTSGSSEVNAVARLHGQTARSHRFLALTSDYLVGRASGATDAPYVVYPRKAGGKPKSMQLAPQVSLDWPISISGNNILVTENVHKGQLIKLVNIPDGTSRTLIGLPTSHSRIPVPLLHDQTLLVGLGRDLLIFDLRNNRLRRYIKNFIPAVFKDNGFGLDTHRIARLMIDRDRLIALTFYGQNSRIVPLASLGIAGR